MRAALLVMLASCAAERARVAPVAPDGMVWIAGGEFSMGDDELFDARPVHRVRVDGFFIDRTEVTNAQFARFVEQTGYRTVAERAPGSTVFVAPRARVPLDSHLRWWRYVESASWRHPLGDGSDLAGRENFPVVQVAYEDAA
jgi:formylglycine-generating enzyme required for sulfatase activity